MIWSGDRSCAHRILCCIPIVFKEHWCETAVILYSFRVMGYKIKINVGNKSFATEPKMPPITKHWEDYLKCSKSIYEYIHSFIHFTMCISMQNSNIFIKVCTRSYTLSEWWFCKSIWSFHLVVSYWKRKKILRCYMAYVDSLRWVWCPLCVLTFWFLLNMHLKFIGRFP